MNREAANITLLGYYGYGNLGDEISLREIVRTLKSGGAVNITVLGRNPYIGRAPLGVRLADGRSPAAVIRALISCDLLIAGSGTLLQNATGEWSLIYYTSIMRLAAMMGKEVRLYGGVGPVSGRAGKRRAAAALRCCSGIYVRDRFSAEAVRGLCGRDAVPAADPLLLLRRKNEKPSARRYGYMAVQLRRRADGNGDDASAAIRAAELCRRMREETGLRPLFVSMQDSYDFEICSASAALCGGKVVSPTAESELASLISGASAAVGMRLHFLLEAAATGTPAAALSYDPKIDGAAEICGIKGVFPAESFRPPAVCEALLSAMEAGSMAAVPPKEYFSGAELALCARTGEIEPEFFQSSPFAEGHSGI